MKVLMQMDLTEELIEEIRQVAEEVEVVQRGLGCGGLGSYAGNRGRLRAHQPGDVRAAEKAQVDAELGSGGGWSAASRTGRERCGAV